MAELQRDKTFEPSGVSGKLKIVLHDVSSTAYNDVSYTAYNNDGVVG